MSERARARRARAAGLGVSLGVVALAACRGAQDQTALAPAGPQARGISHLWWFALTVATAAYLLTMLALLLAARRARRRERERPEGPGPRTRHELEDQGGMRRGVTLGLGATVVALLFFLGYDLSVGRTLNNPGVKNPITIEVVGHQWWWEVRYADTTPQGRFVTANELHIPVGRPVRLILTARDVIHSIWVPNLAGKKDLVPGYTQEIWFQADTPGVYRGQCAEFCGQQHAKMALFVMADRPADYDRWVQGQRQPAAQTPSDPAAAAGQQVFLSSSCAMCHHVAGSPAGSVAGPDLTHLASRGTIAAGTVPNTRGNLAGWVVDPQRIKPGNHMPPNALASKDLDALLAYLQSLK